MRVAKIRTAYPDYLQSLYRRMPDLSKKPYEEQKNTLAKDFFSWPEVFPKYLTNYGFSAIEFLANAQQLQTTWAKERLPNESSQLSLREILIKQLQAFKPDIIYTEDHNAINDGFADAIRSLVPSCRSLIAWCAVPVRIKEALSHFDLVLTCSQALGDGFRTQGINVEVVHHAFDPDVLAVLTPGKIVPFSFCGQIVRNSGYHGNRETYLKAIARSLSSTQFSIYTGGLNKMWSSRDAAKLQAKKLAWYLGNSILSKKSGLGKRLLSQLPEKMPVKKYDPDLSKHIQPPVFGKEMLDVLFNSTGTFNIHVDAAASFACNMRLFEATGVGSCLLTDHKPNLGELFSVDSEILTYKSVGECIEKARWIVDHPTEAKEIGEAAKKRVLKQHTYHERMAEYAAIFRNCVK